VTRGKPLLGICLGMQLLATRSTEHGDHQGLGWIPGVVDRLPDDDPDVRIPHMGWNDVRFLRTGGLFRDLGESQTFYFVHSYALRPDDPALASGQCDYGTTFTTAIEHENLFATQFHPEKSQKTGLAVLHNFATA
jgi:glutamine amidotransferase